ncbi:MAG: adenylate/guanylate cyclase domain-containing protein [Thermodesulfobacteriota bacterium]
MARRTTTDKFYRERFEAQRRLAERMATSMEVNEILERLREEARALVPQSMEACILLLDPEAPRYTRPLQCALYDRPINCQSCKRDRPAIQKAIQKKKTVLVPHSEPVARPDGSKVPIGPEIAIPVFLKEELLAVVSVVLRPEGRITRKEFYLLKDLAESVGHVILRAKKHWEVTQEKIRISQVLSHLSPFVPLSVRSIVEKNPEMANLEKEKKDVTVLFLDLEDYTRLSASRPDIEVNRLVEDLFSTFVDPIQRSHGDIVETAGDGLMIVFKDHDARANAINAVKAALDIHGLTREHNARLGEGLEPVRVNIGINSGLALVGMTRFTGSLGTRMTYTASGTVTNLAARLAAFAKGGDILLGEETVRLIEGLWPVYERGVVTLKGIQEPVRIFSLFPET